MEEKDSIEVLEELGTGMFCNIELPLTNLFSLDKNKYGACCTGITQNVEDLLRSDLARTMLANSELIIMLNQASTDRTELAKLLNISDQQLSFITNVEAGHGLLKVGNSLIPFVNKFPKNTELYRLMNTKLNEIF